MRVGTRRLLGILLAVGALASLGTPVTASAATPVGCPTTTAFEADGYRGGETLPNWTASRFNTAPPAGWTVVPVPYSAGIFPGIDPQTLDPSVADGVARMRQAVLEKHRPCPDTRLVLTGFSEGALVAGGALESFAGSEEIPHSRINGVLYGNPRRPLGEGGIGGRAGGIETNLPTILPGVTMRGDAHYGDLPVRDVCNENDGICNSTNLITNLAAFANGLQGYRSGDHAYTLDPPADLGSGLTFHRQTPKIPYGPPLPLAIGTPYEIQQRLGSASGPDRVAAARPQLTTLLGRDADHQLTDTSPWYRLIQAAR